VGTIKNKLHKRKEKLYRKFLLLFYFVKDKPFAHCFLNNLKKITDQFQYSFFFFMICYYDSAQKFLIAFLWGFSIGISQ